MNRAARLYGPWDVRLSDEALPPVNAGELLLEVGAVGLCGSDRHQYLEGGIGGEPIERPLVLGHEVGGVVAAGDRSGQRVAIDPAIPCRRCEACRKGLLHLCPEMRFAGLGQTDGGLQRYLAWPADRCAAVPDAIRDDEMPMLEVLGIALHSIDLGGATSGMRAGVFGCGPVGLILIRALRSIGVDVVVATDRLPRRLAAAEASGAAATVLVGEADGPTSVPAVDIAFECAGESGSTDDALRALAPGGLVLLVGIPESARASHVAGPARRKELGLRWVRRMADGDLRRAIDAVETGRVSLAGLVTATFGLDEAGAAFEALASRSELKIVVTPGLAAAG